MPRVLAVSAHAADYVWRAGGTLAKYAQQGNPVRVLVLSYGEKGESGELWKQPGQTIDNVKEVRRAESTAAAAILGVEIEFLDWGDYPLRIDDTRLETLVLYFRNYRPEIVITQGHYDPFNPDHVDVAQAVLRAQVLSQSPGYHPEVPTIPPAKLFGFEHHQPELSQFKPEVIVDITSAFETKRRAMECFAAQKHLIEYYTMRAHTRGNNARRISGISDYRYAEAFERVFPYVGGELL